MKNARLPNLSNRSNRGFSLFVLEVVVDQVEDPTITERRRRQPLPQSPHWRNTSLPSTALHSASR
ncbi:hypothetical protein M231_01056 [Tremella mesenterica]|uniref:Uncharacterized protein n=1 Tax=Tremella mesenterica TaxID=5217 RepID=A0A4V1M4U2_TREME|nr:hypothetical protein M231_01056 [Tremella mesenterica]